MRFEDKRLCSITRIRVHSFEKKLIALTDGCLCFPLTGKGKYLRANDGRPISKSKEPT